MKKLERKVKRHQHILMRDGVLVSEDPTKILAISNAGLVNGLSEDIVLKSLSKFGVSDIRMPSGKSYCFLWFDSIKNAKSCYISCNGKLDIAQGNKPIFLCFIQALPEIVDTKIWDVYPPGLIFLEDFITENEEKLLMCLQNFTDMQMIGNMKNRQVKHYGFEFIYGVNNVDSSKPLPDKIPCECDFLWPRLAANFSEFTKFIPDQLTVNQYLPGQGIPFHVDTHSAFVDPLISLSLGSSIVMEFRNENEDHYCVLLPRRSLIIMTKESRYLWTHGITSRKYDVIRKNNKCDFNVRGTRISYTFRKLRNGECDCQFPSKCDSFLNKSKKSKMFTLSNERIAEKLEKVHVHDVYQKIADHFSDTRHRAWPNIVKFIESLEEGSLLIDIGCGNGKYLQVNRNIFSLGCDRSLELVNVCNNRGMEVVTCDCLAVPFRDNITDACICIAVIHHLSTNERRFRAIKEIVRILKPGGSALIYVWAKDQFLDNKKSTYIKDPIKENDSSSSIVKQMVFSEELSLPVHTNRTQFKHQDLLVPWKLKEHSEEKETYMRFYHVFEQHELERICAKLPSVEILNSYYDQGNWCVKFQKKNV